MELFQTILLEYILGYILQGFAFILGIYAFNRKKIEAKQYLIASGMHMVISFGMRQLPIFFGAHTIFVLVGCFLIAVLYIKIPVLHAIKTVLIITLVLLGTELLNVLVMTAILGEATFNTMMTSVPSKYVVGLPAALGFALIIFLSYYFICIRKRKGKKNGEESA